MIRTILYVLVWALAATLVVSCTLNTFAVSSSTKNTISYVKTQEFDNAADRVFTVLPYTAARAMVGGTGFLIELPGSKQPVLITNRHVCESGMDLDEPTKLELGYSEGGYWLINQGRFYVGELLAKSNDTDLCAIKPSEEVTESHSAYQVSEVPIKTGDAVTLYGHPHLLPLTAYSGRVLNVFFEPIGMKTQSFSASKRMYVGRLSFQIFSGNSGSPLVDKGGKVSGVAFAMDRRDDVGLFIPRVDLIDFLKSVEKGESK